MAVYNKTLNGFAKLLKDLLYFENFLFLEIVKDYEKI